MNFKKKLSKLLAIYLAYKWKTLIVLGLSIAISAITAIIPIVNKIIIDNVFTQKVETLFWKLALILLGCYFLQFLLQVGIDYLINKMQMKFLYDKRMSVLNSLALNEIVIDEDISSSYIFARFNEINSIASLVSSTIVKFLISILTLVISLIYLYYLDPLLILMLVVISPVYYIVTKMSLKNIGNYSRKILEINSFTYSLYMGFFKGLNSLKRDNYALVYIDKIRKKLNESFFNGLKQAKFFAFGQNSISLSVSLTSLILLGYFAIKIMNDELTIGDYVATQQYVSYVFLPLTLWSTFQLSVEPAFIALDRIDEVFFTETTSIATEISKVEIVELKDVNYLGRISQNHNQIFEKGKINYIEGGNGYGKSTIFRILSKIYVPDKGEIKINGLDINTLSAKTYWTKISYCPQTDFLFEGTVLENICLNKKQSIAKINSILSSIGLEDLLADIQLGYLVESDGINLSGGQRKKIAFLRSVIKEADLYMFDEPYEGLDIVSKDMVYKYLAGLAREKIVIITSHVDI